MRTTGHWTRELSSGAPGRFSTSIRTAGNHDGVESNGFSGSNPLFGTFVQKVIAAWVVDPDLICILSNGIQAADTGSSSGSMKNSSIGSKSVMAVTGLILFGFVIVHMLGNLQIFLGPEALNSYAHKLKSMPPLVWTVRLTLLAAVIIHLAMAIRLTLQNRAARPVDYIVKDYVRATPASRTMFLTGLVILAFIIYHLAHFTLLMVHQPSGPGTAKLASGEVVPDVYGMVVYGFSHWAVAGSYIVAQVMLGVHLSHGASSMFQTLGLNARRYRKLVESIGPASAAVIVVGNCSMPIAVLLGLIGRAQS